MDSASPQMRWRARDGLCVSVSFQKSRLYDSSAKTGLPVVAQEGWVRNGELLATLANSLQQDQLPDLRAIISHTAIDRLIVNSRAGFVPRCSIDDDDLRLG